MRTFINSVLLFLLFFTLTSFQNNNHSHKAKSEDFPVKAVKLIENELSGISILDTTYLLQFDYLKFIQNLSNSDKEFKEVNNANLTKYFNYLYVKGILNTLYDIEADNDDSELKKGLLFKISIQIKNRPVSKDDLEFVFENWDLDQIKDL